MYLWLNLFITLPLVVLTVFLAATKIKFTRDPHFADLEKRYGWDKPDEKPTKMDFLVEEYMKMDPLDPAATTSFLLQASDLQDPFAEGREEFLFGSPHLSPGQQIVDDIAKHYRPDFWYVRAVDGKEPLSKFNTFASAKLFARRCQMKGQSVVVANGSETEYLFEGEDPDAILKHVKDDLLRAYAVPSHSFKPVCDFCADVPCEDLHGQTVPCPKCNAVRERAKPYRLRQPEPRPLESIGVAAT
jgi:hypothetical protein